MESMGKLAEHEVCFLCLSQADKQTVIPAPGSEKIFENCSTFLLSAITNHFSNIIEMKEHRPLCKKCFESALELTELNEQAKKLQKEISDLSVLFSLGILHRRSQSTDTAVVNRRKNQWKISSAKSPKQIIQLDVTGLPIDIEQLISSSLSHTCTTFEPPVVENLIFVDNFQGNEIRTQNDPISISPDSQIDFTVETETEQAYPNLVYADQYNNVPEFNIVTPEADPLEETVDMDYKPFADTTKTTITVEEGFIKSVKMPKIHLQRLNTVLKKTTAPTKNLKTKINSHKHLLKKGTEKTFGCRYCDKTFKRSDTLKMHERIHTGEKPYVCSFCQNAFSQRSTLVEHMRIHTGDKPYKCELCKKSFNRPGQLKHHQESQHPTKPSVKVRNRK